MDSSNDTELTQLAKRSIAALLLQAAVSFLVFQVAVVNLVAEGYFLVLLMVSSLLCFGLAIHAADRYFLAGRYFVCWLFPIPPVCIFLIFLVFAFAQSFASGGPWC